VLIRFIDEGLNFIRIWWYLKFIRICLVGYDIWKGLAESSRKLHGYGFRQVGLTALTNLDLESIQ
jgi:hypothetical protein